MAACSIFIAACSNQSSHVYSGTVQAETVQVGSVVGGRIVAVAVSDGAAVRAGQVIVRFDDADARAALRAAQARSREAQAKLDAAIAGSRPEDVARAQAQADQAAAALAATQGSAPHQLGQAQDMLRQRTASAAQAQAAATQAERDYRRSAKLFATGAISAQALDASRSQRDQAAANAAAARDAAQAARQQYEQLANGSVPGDVGQAQAAYAAASSNLAAVRNGPRREDVAALRAARDAAQADVAVAQVRLDRAAVRAPADGTVESIDLRVGDLVMPGAVVATIAERLDPYARIYAAQRDLGRFHVGANVPVRAESLGGRQFDGRVEVVDSRAQFTPRDVQTADDRAGLVYGVKIRIHDPQRELYDGTTVTVAP